MPARLIRAFASRVRVTAQMDNITPEKRSEVMAAVKSKGTKLERTFFEELERRGIGPFEHHRSDLTGKPDLAHEESKIVVFVDRCFWHGCPKHLRMPEANRGYWEKKIAGNRKRDKKVTEKLREEGWLVLRIWEHSIKKPQSLKWWLTRIETLISERSR